MAVIFSTGLINHVLVTGSLRAAINGHFAKIHDGSAPANADAAGTGTLLWAPDDGAAGGFSLDASAVGKTLSMDSTTQNAAAAATGTGTYFRLLASGDANGSSSTEKRIQGTVGTGATDPLPDMILASASFTSAVTPTNPLNAFTISFPEAFAPGMSTGLVQYLLVTGSLKAAIDGYMIMFYDGTVPATADAAISGDSTEIFKLTEDGDGVTGLTWDATPVSGALVKNSAAWEGTAIASPPGPVTYARIQASGDTLGASTTERRYQLTCGIPGSGAQIEMGTTTILGSSNNVAPSFALKFLAQAT